VNVSRVLAVSLGSAALVAMGSAPASAGEVTGTGAPAQGAAHAKSICAFSGLNDDTAEEPGRTQSYGQLVRIGLRGVVPGPGVACNGHTGFLAGGGSEG